MYKDTYSKLAMIYETVKVVYDVVPRPVKGDALEGSISLPFPNGGWIINVDKEKEIITIVERLAGVWAGPLGFLSEIEARCGRKIEVGDIIISRKKIRGISARLVVKITNSYSQPYKDLVYSIEVDPSRTHKVTFEWYYNRYGPDVYKQYKIRKAARAATAKGSKEAGVNLDI